MKPKAIVVQCLGWWWKVEVLTREEVSVESAGEVFGGGFCLPPGLFTTTTTLRSYCLYHYHQWSLRDSVKYDECGVHSDWK